MSADLAALIKAAAAGAALVVGVIVLQSLRDYSRTGPRLPAEVEAHYRFYVATVLARLTFLGWAAGFYWAFWGGALYLTVIRWFHGAPAPEALFGAGLLALALAASLSFCRQLWQRPSNLCASWQYRASRLYPLWRRLSARRLALAGGAALLLVSAGSVIGSAQAVALGALDEAVVRVVAVSGLVAGLIIAHRERRSPPPARADQGGEHPNIVMIGCDTLRVDHLSISGYPRPTSPHIDRLCRTGTLFTQCYVPLARTAPSLAALLGGVWPQQSGIRDNFTDPAAVRLPEETLPGFLRQRGYRTEAIGDWCGSDLRKFDFGFDRVDAPADPWNLKYFLRQGPMLLRLYLSLFLNNFLGRWLIPEIYYQAGNPLETIVGVRACHRIRALANSRQPFLLNVFMAGAHAPFGSEYPYYLAFADADYVGESKFVMTSFRDPNEIAEKQAWGRDCFDLDQIIKLYDGCIRKFDAEVGRITDYLEASGLLGNTILVIYSDHGIEFFENGSWGQGNTVRGADYGGKVPLLIVDPRRPGRGVDDQIVRAVDLLPTLVELCGFQPPAAAAGTSLVPTLDRAFPLNLTAYQETGFWLGKIPGLHPEHLDYPDLLKLIEVTDQRSGTLTIRAEALPLLLQAKDRMVRRGRWKLVYQPLRSGVLYQLYDLAVDPDCRHEVSAHFPAILESLKREIQGWLAADGLV